MCGHLLTMTHVQENKVIVVLFVTFIYIVSQHRGRGRVAVAWLIIIPHHGVVVDGGRLRL